MTPPPNPELRSPRSHQAILDATWDLAVRNGYGKLTIEAIAARAGVGKQTIYRWWPSKGALALDTINEQLGSATDFPDTGDIAADLRTQFTGLSKALAGEVGGVYRGVIAEAQTDPRLAEAVRATIIEPRATQCRARLEIAVAAGQLRADLPTATMVQLLYGPVYFRFLLGVADVADSPALVEQVLDGLRPRG
ncbi:TetR/AcrR family transcriptional regulator [Nocardia yamanashiensis]|uniref:TetR/AcrR family transcriptional regulator n=1 Tax=Nocardia yamanashiensis TaxID=209247 RepID=UPI001E5849EC|nr:TetR/AcrR family transcriptional regulator [Nocardia yamanashiensis]UGT41033.1 TetR/AcrR family transcriptional regulator [Nocardia yamanashiensis]